MAKKWFFTLVTTILATSVVVLFSCTETQKAHMVIYNGTIYTMDETKPVAEAVAVEGGTIVFVGSNREVKKRIGKETGVIDLQGMAMTPGFIESHGHMLSLGYAKMRLELGDIKNYDELATRVADAVRKTAPGEWILGRGWHQSKWEPQPDNMVRGFQTHQLLSSVSPVNPVYVTHASGHAGFANARAMAIAGVTHSTKFRYGGEIIKDDKGNPTGIFNEEAQELITRHIPESTPTTDQQALGLAIDECLANGITTFHDAGCGADATDMYNEFLNKGKLKIRMSVMLKGENRDYLKKWYAKGPQIGLGNNFLTIRSVKLLADGALGSRGAWLLEPYEDRPGHLGHETIPMETVYTVAKECLEHGFQICVHAIGDRANREVLNQFEKALKEYPEAAKNHRFRIEHAQHISATDIPRFGKLGVIASMQGIHMSSDRPWAIDRLGKERIVEGAYVWQKLLSSGAKIINGTDTPVEPVSPVACFYASVTRRTLKGLPTEGYEADQKMTREQALRSYTLDAAYGGFEENAKGSIEVGKYADFTVFSQDIMRVPDDELLATEIAYTIIGGKIVYNYQWK